jgi:hypothetical protein
MIMPSRYSFAAINVESGKHRLHVELVTSAHREFAPPMLTDETITVSGIGPLPQLPDCPRAPRAMP